ncbi:MAG: PilZ domain-containing protein [Pseudomonadota bacterium]
MMDPHSIELDRRRSKRYRMKGIAFAVLKSESDEELGQVVNISHGGLAFEYFVGSRRIRNAKYLDLMLMKSELYIHKIPVRTISDFEIKNELPFNTIAKRQQGVCFETLTEEQEKQVEFLIRCHTQSLP